MAPLSHYLNFRKVLLFSLFAFTLLPCFFFVFATSDQSLSVQSQVYLGGRNLLAKNDRIIDDGDLLLDVVPRKKKASSSLSLDENELPKKKKSSSPSLSDDDAKVVPKKKTPSSSNNEVEVSQVPKKKKSLNLEDDDEEKVVKKKKSSTSILEDDDEKQALKKKKSSKLEDDDAKQASKKKKSSNLEDDGGEKEAPKKKESSTSLSSSSSKNQTKITKPKTSNLDSSSSKYKTTNTTPLLTKLKLKKLNSTSKLTNSAKSATKKSLDLLETISAAKDKTISSQDIIKKSSSQSKTDTSSKTEKSTSQNPNQKQKSSPSWMYQDDKDEDLVSEFRDLPIKFHQAFIPDLHRISTTSKIYLNKYNKEITKGFKPYVGNKYATSVATAISFAFIIVPFLLVSLIFNRIKAYFSLQKLIIFVQIYLSIYFSILCLSSLITGLEPLRFFYETSQSTYVWLQVLQTLAYVLYLLLLLMYLVLVFSTETDMGQKFLGLGQTFVGFTVGLHYYMAVFHKVVLRQPPKTNWKIHGIYATCFLVVCLFARAERRKKAYLNEEGSDEGKKS